MYTLTDSLGHTEIIDGDLIGRRAVGAPPAAPLPKGALTNTRPPISASYLQGKGYWLTIQKPNGTFKKVKADSLDPETLLQRKGTKTKGYYIILE